VRPTAAIQIWETKTFVWAETIGHRVFPPGKRLSSGIRVEARELHGAAKSMTRTFGTESRPSGMTIWTGVSARSEPSCYAWSKAGF
jgi:hypothetical protein